MSKTIIFKTGKYPQVKPNFNPSVLIIRGYNIENELFTHQYEIEIVNSSLNFFFRYSDSVGIQVIRLESKF